MQLVMVGILGCSLGLAALVRHVRVGPSGVPLRQGGRFGKLKFRMPDWDLKEVKGTFRSDGQLPLPLCILGVEPSPAGSNVSRVLELYQQEVPKGMSPEQYLQKGFDLPENAPLQPMKMLGRQGILVNVPPSAAQTRHSRDEANESQIFACTIVQGWAVTVRLHVGGRPVDERDVALVQQVADSLQMLNLNDENLPQ